MSKPASTTAPKPSLLERLRGLVGNNRLLPLERELVRRTILALDQDPKKGSTPDEILEASERLTFKEGQLIISEGEPESCLYVLLDGTAAVERDDKVLERLRAGEVFGEIALLTNEPRMATVRALEDAVVLRIPGAMVDTTLRERLWDYAGERRFMSLRENPIEEMGRRHLWWRQARTTLLPPGEYDAGSPWVFLYSGALQVEGQVVRAPALFPGGRLRVEQGEIRLAMLPDPLEVP